MHPNDSFQYDKPSQYRDSYQNTAAKSPEKKRVDQTQQYTPTKFTRKPSERVSQLKNSINKCIQQFSNKKELNRQALQEVKDVNREAIDTLSGQASSKGYKSSRKPFDQQQQPQYRTDYAPRYDPRDDKHRQNITLSSFHLGPVGTVNQNQVRGSNFQTSQVYRPESMSSQLQETQQIRQKIRNERAQNQNLQRQIQSLRREQQELTLSGPNFVNQDPYLTNQNIRLRQELASAGDNSSFNSIYEQFQKLKQDNQRLRRQTINLLKNPRY